MPVNRLMLEMFDNCEFTKHKSNLEVAVLNGVIESRDYLGRDHLGPDLHPHPIVSV